MKKLVLPLMVVALLVVTVCPVAADGEYIKVVISYLDISVPVQPVKLSGGSWSEPRSEAWCLVPDSYRGQKDCLQAIYLPNPEILRLPRGTVVWVFERESWRWLCLRVFGTTFVAKESSVLGVVGGDVFALIVPDPASDRVAVVWADRAPRRTGLWR